MKYGATLQSTSLFMIKVLMTHFYLFNTLFITLLLQALSGVFFNKGENCIAAGRIFVEDSIHDEFVQKVIDEVKKMKIGNPLDRSVDHGPQNHLAHLNSLIEYVKVCYKNIETRTNNTTSLIDCAGNSLSRSCL